MYPKKIKILSVHQDIFAWLRIFPFANATNRKTQFISKICMVSVLIIKLLSLVSSVAYLYRNVSSEVDLGFSITQISGWASTFYTLVVAYIIRNQLRKLFDKIQEIYDDATDDMKGNFIKINEKSEFLTKYCVKYFIVGFVAYVCAMAMINILFCYLINGHVDAKCLWYPPKYVLPWNQHTVIGWIGMLIFLVLVCEFHKVFYSRTEHLLAELDEVTDETPMKLKRNPTKSIQSILCQIIKNNIKGKEFFKYTADVYSSFLFIQVIFDILFLAAAALQVYVSVKNPSLNMLTPFIGIVNGLANLLVYCYIAYRASDNYVRIGDLLYQSVWYKLPTKYRKYFVLMIQDSQTPQLYHGFGIIKIDMGTFATVLRTVYSYFMAMKTIGENII
ncbi:uncharacterized protein LOC116338167 isoform X2 [Contarinia nasturtii]|uniref:uncharacterized protein LOC116338167 isoform X2 n=1 Tax=Contarinia nasturtii TaxID=265458 RepID=UPI0012D49DA9|nr:uncharacterized protein LOC116338167 isoform X2 [Contarinia nasturtii]